MIKRWESKYREIKSELHVKGSTDDDNDKMEEMREEVTMVHEIYKE